MPERPRLPSTRRLAGRSIAAVAVSALAIVLACGAGCKPKATGLTVGAYLSLSGPDSTFGMDTKDGIALAIEQVNAAGGVAGKRVKVLYEDDRSLPGEATNKVSQLIDRDKVVAVMGEVASSRSIAGGIVCNRKHVPMISPSSTAVEVTEGREWVFRTSYTDAQQGAAAARYTFEAMGKRRAAIFFAAQDTFSSGLAQRFKAAFIKLGGAIAVEKGFPKGETNFTTYLRELRAEGPDVIFAPVYYHEMVQIARQAKEVAIPGSIFVGGDGWDSQNLIEGAGAELEGAHFTNGYAPDAPSGRSRAFVQAFQARYRRPPTSIAALGYDAAKLLADALGRAPDASPETLRAALRDTKDFPGVTGTMTIDGDRNAIKPVVVIEVRDKAFHYKTELSAM